MPPRIVILDTNFLLVPFQFKINILKELDYMIESSHKFVISSVTIDELKKMGAKKGKDAISARLALKIIENNPIDIIKNDRKVDDWIVEYSKENRAIVCTNDAPLRKRLKPLGIKVATVKSRSKLGFV
jgi:rRNA-processing protein FCF1